MCRTYGWCCSVLAMLVLAAGSAGADSSTRLIVAFREAPAARGAASSNAPPSAASASLGALRLHAVARLGDPRPAPSPGTSAHRATGGRAGEGPGPSADATLDPSRVWLFEAADSAVAAAALTALRSDPAIAWVEHDATREAQLWSLSPAKMPSARVASGTTAPSSFPNDPLFQDGRQWGLANRGVAGPYGGLAGADVRALDAWRLSRGANAVLLAIADTGIDEAHPDLGGTLADGTSRIAHATDIVAGASVHDLYGHGTPVAGVAAARTNNGAHFDSLGVAGVCGGDGGANAGCRIMPIKITVAASSATSSFYIAQAVLRATDLGARVVNVSFAGTTPSRLERLAMLYAITHGCVPVAAAGNSGAREGDHAQYPAAYAADGLCVQVGASDAWDRRAAFSSYGPGLDLLAPGVDVWTTFMTYPSAAGGIHPGYVAASGTSFAAPFVTGAIGLLAAARPELCDVDFQRLLRESAHDLGAPGPDRETGWGRLDLAAALASVGAGIGIWHDEVAATRFEAFDTDTLVLDDNGFGPGDPGHRLATRVRASATVALPDSFIGPVTIWPRLAGTTTTGNGFVHPYFTPWAEITDVRARRFTISGWIFRTAEDALPFPEDETRFGFTVIGRVNRGAPLVMEAPGVGSPESGGSGGGAWRLADPDVATLSATPAHPLRAVPNPFVRQTRIASALPGTLGIYDIRGRRVRRVRLDGSLGRFDWDGTSDDGRPLGPGVYLLRAASGGPVIKLLKLE